jgi:multicomponent Na+:H+ antiporter subunit B
MRYSVIVRTTGYVLLPLLALFSLYLLLRGHNAPGGGFIGGLVAAAAVTLYVFSVDVAAARRVLGATPQTVFAIGLIIATLSAFPGAFLDEPFFKGVWTSLDVPGFGELKLGTPLLFDVGVYLTVIGFALTIVLTLAEAEE